MIPETFGKLHFVYENFSRYLDDVLFGCLVVLFGNLVFSNITTRFVFAHSFDIKRTGIFPMSECHGTLVIGCICTHDHCVQNSSETELWLMNYRRS